MKRVKNKQTVNKIIDKQTSSLSEKEGGREFGTSQREVRMEEAKIVLAARETGKASIEPKMKSISSTQRGSRTVVVS